MATVVCLGDASVDMVAAVGQPLEAGVDAAGRAVLTIGGFGAVVAAWQGKLGQASTLLACVGDDAMGQYIRSQSQRLRVKADITQVVAGVRTGATVHITDADGVLTTISDPGANERFALSTEGAAAIERADVLVMSAATFMRPSTREAAIAALDVARAHSTVVVVDTANANAIVDCGPSNVRRFLDQVDIIIGNDEEVASLTSDQPSGWLGSLPNLVIKHGPGGASWWSNGAAVTRRPSRVSALRDVTGAGDAFTAGVMTVLAQHGDFLDIPKPTKQQALEAGATAAAMACEQSGAWPR